ncbi:MAG: hypothetical protein COV32_02630 [Candidatus Yonathbacteria bacterium CG10_big_fil_rev_8_21_14_0_10_43_136]|uniref:Uncharacterized protein n=2 Tax=Parcubacteria group TaxID=1794811 RepID=A0A2M7Q4Q9_9BACT|nr:MAG: hypothetical protein COW60_02895 [Candidatus Yonathbacteria bacterium CG17_big_fil_post_rev_8_21_14_2_50_43_9]PIR40571.1 MAG: hypothetical protein COV32_02630 [Candidatus Yonathbacteria bacterium CG10_big_fil_rev_8_21_14_0_10_43_136]PIX56948.1 MAG: hypothetical protein COZ48_03370 [Candidatus Yonathbacteria bacterium CG_4_10_14_3_um_filter_43_12]PIY58085.1 MAG: hypothetical protein COY98_03970 [Candidatus Yonathbacteria bacterium CG_4_10_14_0_8_um_filter_43_17]PJC22303.1 MAG: hypothetic
MKQLTINKIRGEQLTPLRGQLTTDRMRLGNGTSDSRVSSARKPAVSCQLSKVNCSRSGFTLVEMIVSLGLFTIIMFIATSALLSIVNTDRKARSVRVAADNLNIALEDMSRRIKTGSSYDCGAIGAPTDCAGGSSSLTFKDQDENLVTYSWDNTNFSILRDGTPITSTEITISNLKFIVSGSAVGSADNEQPMVVIVIDGSLGSGTTESGFKIQTTVTQRAYDNQ